MICMHASQRFLRGLVHGGLNGVLIAATFAFVAAPSANAAANVVLLPPIPVLPSSARLAETGAMLGTSVQGSISITDPQPLPLPNPPFFQIQSAFDSYSSPLGFVSVGPSVNGEKEDAFRETSDGRGVSVGTTSGFINSTAIASPGKLRAQATAGGGGGSVSGISTATAMFVDTIQLGHGGGYSIDWNVHGSVTGGFATLTPDVRPRTRPGASAQIRAQVWWVPFETNLTQAAASNFLGSVYQSSTWTYNLQTGETVITDESRQADFGEDSAFTIFERDGTKFWVVGLLEVSASRGAGDGGTVLPSSFVTGTANFLNTIELTIDSFNFPGQSDVISASGHDYSIPSPVPEPSTFALLALGGVFLSRLRRSGDPVSI